MALCNLLLHNQNTDSHFHAHALRHQSTHAERDPDGSEFTAIADTSTKSFRGERARQAGQAHVASRATRKMHGGCAEARQSPPGVAVATETPAQNQPWQKRTPNTVKQHQQHLQPMTA